MGQKSHPYGLRLGYIKDWRSKWFARGNEYRQMLHEDLKIRKFLKTRLKLAGLADITIERSGKKIFVWIHTARPGIVIGRGGQELERLCDELSDLTKSEISRQSVKIKEVENPQADAQLVAENVVLQLEKRVSFRKAMKKAVSSAMMKGAGGIKIMCKGRLGGAEIARTEGYKEGKVPLSTFRANVNYGFAEAFTTYGTIGVKVWIYLGDILVKKELAEIAKQQAERFKVEGKTEAGSEAEKSSSVAESVPAAVVPAESATSKEPSENDPPVNPESQGN